MYYYWQTNTTIEINIETIHLLYQYMLGYRCFVPIFSQHLYDHWVQLNPVLRSEPQNTTQMILNGYL